MATQTCIAACEAGYIFDTTSGTCKNCKSLKQFKVNDACSSIASCESINLAKGPNFANTNNCVTCASMDSNKSYLDLDTETCINICLENSIIDSVNRTCRSCSKQKKILENKTCLECPTNTYFGDNLPSIAITTLPVISTTTNTTNTTNTTTIVTSPLPVFSPADLLPYRCVDLLRENMYFQDGTVSSKCSDKYITDSKHICNNCFYYLGQCVLDCPENYFKQQDNTCKSCKDLNKFEYNKQCIEKCPYDYDSITTETTSDNICKTCAELNKFSSKTGCVSKCNELLIVDDKISKCIDCQDTFQVKLSNQCLNHCPPGNVVDSSINTCVSGKDLNNNKF